MFLIVSCSQNEEKNQSEQKIINKQIENDSEPSRVDNYFWKKEKQISEIYLRDNKTKKSHSKQISYELTLIFHDIKWNKITPKFSDDLILEYEKLVQFIISQWQYVDIQNLIEFQYMVRFNENNHFDEIKKELIEKNVIFSFHDQVLLTAEQVEKSLNKIPKCNIW